MRKISIFVAAAAALMVLSFAAPTWAQSAADQCKTDTDCGNVDGAGFGCSFADDTQRIGAENYGSVVNGGSASTDPALAKQGHDLGKLCIEGDYWCEAKGDSILKHCDVADAVCVYPFDYAKQHPDAIVLGVCVATPQNPTITLLPKPEEKKDCASFFSSKNGKLNCPQLFKADSKGTTCLFTGSDGVSLNSDSASNFRDLIDQMQPLDGKTFEGTTTKGKSVKVGVLRQMDGSYTFTSDGIHYYDNMKAAAAPGFFSRIGTSFDNVKRGFLQFFGIGKFTGAGTSGEGGAVTQAEGQGLLDTSKLTLDVFQKALKDPQKRAQVLVDGWKQWSGNADNLNQGDYGSFLAGLLQQATGCDVPFLETILKKAFGAGQAVAEDADKVNALLMKLSTAPGDAVATLADEVRKADFSKSVDLYAQERDSGKDPKAIFDQMQAGQEPQLDFVTNIKGFNQQFSQRAVFSAYEEAYQRYQLLQSLKK